MEYEKKYKDAQKWMESIYAELSHERQMEAEAFFPELKESKRGDTREELISFLEELSKLGRDTNFDKWTTSDCAKWVAWVQKQDPTWFEEELEKAYKNGYEDAKREILGLADIESMAKAYEQRLINTMSNHPSIKLSVASFIHGANCVLDELYLKKCQVKESTISQHKTKTCEENNDFSTSEDEKIKKDIVSFLRSKNGYMNPCEDWDFHNRWIPWLEKHCEQDKQYMYDVIVALWDLLDKIDTVSELYIDDTDSDNPFRKIMHITQERHKFVKSDGYNLFIEGVKITNRKSV